MASGIRRGLACSVLRRLVTDDAEHEELIRFGRCVLHPDERRIVTVEGADVP
ncbi:hypothetical protein RB623_16130 [Mesorhizobium sp. LHD-90]|uniref:hypothetical protein n=1 Tax=Mesorhizobium sp. LHD-90 TaxID=3071414 RepID=UPI0027DEEE37|nr:hypothetical protein [Mesorhizobium sp. LHD-90]MDQ6435587.1 hypothetical protein [Mesorhizobium sp. LHD-90]